MLLSRGYTKPDKFVESELALKVQGFDSQDITLLFGELNIDETSSEDKYSDEIEADEILDEVPMALPSEVKQSEIIDEVPMQETIMSGRSLPIKSEIIESEYSEHYDTEDKAKHTPEVA